MTEQPVRDSEGDRGRREIVVHLPRARVSAVVAVAAAAAVALWLALGGASSSSPRESASRRTTNHTASHPVVAILSHQGLTKWARSIHNLLYWEGPAKQGFSYGLTQNTKGWLYVSYIPPGEKVTPDTPLRAHQYVATFPFRNAYAATAAVAAQSRSLKLSAPSGEVAFSYRAYPTSAYLAVKGSDYQIQVFDPDPARVRHLIASGAIRPVAHVVPAPRLH